MSVTTRFSNEFKAGVFVLIMLGVAICSLVYLGVQKDLFSEKVFYYVVSPTGEKIERGVPVKISGFRVGEVSNVQMHGIDYIKIELKVLKRYQNWFTRGVKVTLSGGFPIGSAWVDVIPGPENAPVLSDGASLELSHSQGVMGTLEARLPAMMDDVQAILHNVRTITASLSNDDKAFAQTLENLRILTGSFVDAQGFIKYIIHDPEPAKKVSALLAEGNNLLRNINTTVSKASGNLGNVEVILKDVEHLVTKLNTFVSNVDEMRSRLDPAVDNVGMISNDVKRATTDLVRLRNQAEYTLKLGSDVLQRLRQTWPLRRSNEQQAPKEHPLP